MKKSGKRLCCLLLVLLTLISAIEFLFVKKPTHTHSRKIHLPLDPSDSSYEVKSRNRGSPKELGPIDLSDDLTDKGVTFQWTLKNESAKVVSSENLLGKIKKGKKYLLIYNNVPKCGSRSLAHSIKNVLKKNHVFFGVEIKGDKRKGNDLNKSFRRVKPPAYISGHMPFVQPSRQDIVYINMVRDPIDRFTSLYYFALNGDESGVKPASKAHENITIDDYVRRGGAIESKIFFHFDRDDRPANDTGYKREHLVERVKGNIERYFILVGVTEEMNATVTLLEKLLPDLLHGLRRVYKNTVDEKRHGYSTKYKVLPSNETVAILKEKLKDEYELYYFVKQHFSRLKQQFQVK